MTVTNTSLLGLALPTTGTESGVWGDDVNNGLTILIDVSVAGTNNITQDSDITLAVSNGNNSSSFTSTATNSAVAQYYVLNCSGARTALRNIIVPTTSKTYVVTNGTTGGFGITVKKSGGTGVTVAAGETAIVFYNTVTGDVAKVTSTVNVSSFSAGTTGLTPNTATTGAVTLAGTLVVGNGGTGQTTLATGSLGYGQGTSAHAALAIGTAGQILTVNSGATAPQWTTLTDVAVTTFSAGTTGLTPSTATSGAVTLAGTLATTNGGTGLTSFTANGVVYASSTSALATGSALVFDGANLGVGTSSPLATLDVNNAAARIRLASSTGTNNTLLSFTNTGGTSYVGLDNSAGGLTAAYALNLYQSGAYPITFSTNSAERMRIDSSGNVGIGTNTISAPNGRVYNLQIGTNNAGSSSELLLGHQGDGFSLFTSGGSGAGALSFSQGTSEKMRIDSSGNLGIGTTSPGYLLEAKSSTAQIGITGTGTSSNYLAVGNTNASNTFYFGQDNSAGNNFNTGVAYGPVIWTNASSQTFVTNSGSNIMTYSGGNLGLGVTPSAWASWKSIDINTGGAGVASSGQNCYLTTNAYNNGGWKYKFTTVYGVSWYEQFNGQHAWYSAPSGTAGNAISATQAMTLDASGNLLVGTTSATVSGTGQFYATSNVNGWYGGTFINNNTTGPYGILVQMASASGPNYLAIFRYAGANQCLINYNGNIVNTNGVYGSISDAKLKENIVDTTPKLADLMQVKVRSYNLKSDPTHKQLGVVAQELEQVFPSMVEESKDKDEENNDLGTTTKTVKYSVFVPMLIKAMQEQQVLITAQQSTIQSLTERITALEGART